MKWVSAWVLHLDSGKSNQDLTSCLRVASDTRQVSEILITRLSPTLLPGNKIFVLVRSQTGPAYS